MQGPETLTEQQRKVVEHVVQGVTTVKIAKALGISPKTVEFHRIDAMRRLGISNPVVLTHWALASNMIPNLFTIQEEEEVIVVKKKMVLASNTIRKSSKRPDWTRVFDKREQATAMASPRFAEQSGIVERV